MMQRQKEFMKEVRGVRMKREREMRRRRRREEPGEQGTARQNTKAGEEMKRK